MASKLLESLKRVSILEAALAMNTSFSALTQQLGEALRAELGVKDSWSSGGPWVVDVFPSQVVYQFEGATWRRGYSSEASTTGNPPAITLGKNPIKVHMAFMDNGKEANESVIITFDPGTVAVKESITFDDSVKVTEASALPTAIPVKLIQAGWGSSAYYSKEVLKRDGAKTFPKGTHMYWNHQTATEEVERPVNDISNLAAVLVQDAEWDDNGVKGPGLYSKAKVFSDYATQVAEKGPHIGASINASIRCHTGEAEGKTGTIADEFVGAYSVDFVTRPGAGGQPIVPATESARTEPPQLVNKEKSMDEKAAEALRTENERLKAENAKMQEQQNVIMAVAAVGAILREAEIPFKASLLERACSSPVMKDGKPDPKWVESIVEDFTPEGGGKVIGMGRSKESADDEKAAQERLDRALKNLTPAQAGLQIVGGKK